MTAIQIFMDTLPLTWEQKKKRGFTEGEMLCDEVWYLVDINVHIHPNVPVDRLAEVATAISNELLDMESAPTKVDDVTYNIFTLGLSFAAPKDISDDYIKTQAWYMARDVIEVLQDEDEEKTIEYPFIYQDFSIYLTVGKIPEIEGSEQLPAFHDLSINDRPQLPATAYLSSFYSP